MNLSVEHLGLAARDPAALRGWYVRVLGAREIFHNRETPPAFLLALPAGPMLEIYAADSANADTRNNQLAGWRHLALRVDSIESTRAELTSRGVAFDEPVKPAGGGGRVLFFRDPEGNLLHLVERPPDSPLAAAPQ
jgi:catechol 2,3-dioxygenase-like lactoylglutathione lyase family enzyme